MQKNKRSLTPILHTIFLTSPIWLSSCGVMQQAFQVGMQGNVSEVAFEEPIFMEDFYEPEVTAYEPQAQREANLKERKLLTETEESMVFAAREMTFNIDLMSELSNIGGEDQAVAENVADADGFTVSEEEALQGANFNPATMIGKIEVDVLMDDMSCYSFPLQTRVVNSNFGWRRGRVHAGIDLDLETGDPVFAVIDGTVKKAEYSSGYGNLIVLQHDNGLETYYAHLSKIEVEPGQKVLSGQEIGLGGSTGRSTGPHLHFEVRYQGVYMDPSNLIDFSTGELKSPVLTMDKNTFKMKNDVATAKYHTVRSGDTLGKIARKYGTSVSRICKLNGISASKVIRPGQRLRVR